eukprot:340876-Pelagomonas_calceolata.AAC.1
MSKEARPPPLIELPPPPEEDLEAEGLSFTFQRSMFGDPVWANAVQVRVSKRSCFPNACKPRVSGCESDLENGQDLNHDLMNRTQSFRVRASFEIALPWGYTSTRSYVCQPFP